MTERTHSDACYLEEGHQGCAVILVVRHLARVHELEARVACLEGALRFYADQWHHDGTQEWDTISGEAPNWLFPVGDDDNCAMVENGEIARNALAGTPIDWEADDEVQGKLDV